MRKSALFLVVFLVPFTVFAQSGTWGSRGIAHRFLPRGAQLFDVDGRGVSTYDVSDPQNIRLLSFTSTDSESLDGAFIDGNTLAVATQHGLSLYSANPGGSLTLLSTQPMAGLQLVRANAQWVTAANGNTVFVFTPARDHLDSQGSFTFPGTINAIEVAGSALYVSQGAMGITIVDLTGSVPNGAFGAFANDLAANGNQLFLAGGVDGLIVADISNPLSPRVTGRVGAGSVNLAHVAASGTRAFASESPNVVYAFDVSDPTSPQLVTKTQTPVRTIAATASDVFVSGATFDRFGIASETGVPVQALDPSSLSVSGALKDEFAGPVSGVATDGSLAYVIDHPYFRVIDISNTAAPKEIGTLLTDDNSDSVRVLGKQVLLFSRGDAELVDVSNPYQPRFAGIFHSLGRPPSTAAFARDTIIECNPWSGFHVVDFKNYSPPVQVGGVKGHYTNAAGDGGDTVYVAPQGQPALAIMDIANPQLPVMTKVITTNVDQEEMTGATASHSDLLLVRRFDGIYIYDLTTPLLPANVGVVNAPGATLIGANGDRAIVAIGDTFLRVDLSDPAHPRVTASEATGFSPMQIAVSGEKVVVADRYSLRVFGPNTAPPPPPPAPPAPTGHHRAVRP